MADLYKDLDASTANTHKPEITTLLNSIRVSC
jgi:hypothetical protein